jgi:hypothetical protein
VEAVEAEGRKSPLPLKIANSKQRRKGKSRASTTRLERKRALPERVCGRIELSIKVLKEGRFLRAEKLFHRPLGICLEIALPTHTSHRRAQLMLTKRLCQRIEKNPNLIQFHTDTGLAWLRLPSLLLTLVTEGRKREI